MWGHNLMEVDFFIQFFRRSWGHFSVLMKYSSLKTSEALYMLSITIEKNSDFFLIKKKKMFFYLAMMHQSKDIYKNCI